MTGTNKKQSDKVISVMPFPDLPVLAKHLREEMDKTKFVLLFAYNGTGKTRLSTAVKGFYPEITDGLERADNF